MRTPVARASAAPAWAPGGLAFGPDRIMYVPFLAGRELRAFTTAGDGIAGQASLFPGTSAACGPPPPTGTHLWLTTSNDTSDEKVLRVPFDPASIPAAPAPASSPPPASPAPSCARPSATSSAARPARCAPSAPAGWPGSRGCGCATACCPPGRLSITVDRPAIRRKRARVRILGGKAGTRAGRRAAVTTRLSVKSRRLLRRAARRKGRLKLTLRVGLRTADGRLTTGRRAITILRR